MITSTEDGVIISGDALEIAENVILKLLEVRESKPSLFAECESLRCGFTRALARTDCSLLDDRFLDALDLFLDVPNVQELVGAPNFTYLNTIYEVSM